MMTMEERKQAELDVLIDAVEAIKESERLRLAVRAIDERLRILCRSYDAASGTRLFQPHHLRQACEARGLLR